MGIDADGADAHGAILLRCDVRFESSFRLRRDWIDTGNGLAYFQRLFDHGCILFHVEFGVEWQSLFIQRFQWT
jgi:hypothetical protein